jgi:hypothetical protein
MDSTRRIGARKVGQCFTKQKEDYMKGKSNAWAPDVVNVIWHPTSGEVFGLNMEGLLFKWNPHEEHISGSIAASADAVVISQDGWLVSTGDKLGTIKVFTTSDFAPVYQLSSQDGILRLAFSRDSRRLYDLKTRGTYGSAWEPDALVKIVESLESVEKPIIDLAMDTIATTRATKVSAPLQSRVDTVIAIAHQTAGPLYSYATEAGAVYLCEIGRGKIYELARLPRYISLESMAWSVDGQRVAIVDLSGRLSIKQVISQHAEHHKWQVNQELEHVIPREHGKQGHIRQVLFSLSGEKLFIYSASTLLAVDMSGKVLAKTIFHENRPDIKWICHPLLPGYLLGFRNTQVHVYSSEDLSEIATYTYCLASRSSPFPSSAVISHDTKSINPTAASDSLTTASDVPTTNLAAKLNSSINNSDDASH